MNSKKYKLEVERRGGRKVVAKLLALPLSTIDRRCNGSVARIRREAEHSLLALPVREDWLALRRLKEDAGYRAVFVKRMADLPAGDPARLRSEALLADAEACVPGRKRRQTVG